MLRTLILIVFITFYRASIAKTNFVNNISELQTAISNASPGDTIILKNGEWKNVHLEIDCNGTKQKPVYIKAASPGLVKITGHSSLKLGGNYTTINGLYFTNGYSGNTAVIEFKIDDKRTANNCTIINCVIDNFNNPKRLDENYWVTLYGKYNSIKHCSFLNKKNIGVLMAVMLNNEKDRENFHEISNNYFGVRLPLASNGGEIIRVGVSEYCQYNSNTQIIGNFFEKCDGETEIISIKSGHNLVKNNYFKECQGSVVLRHGNENNIVANIFYGNNKAGTGGVRVINKGHWVIKNLFYQCRGEGFRSPLSIMNGVPNSPAYRYVSVSDVVIANNTFIDCTPMSFCEGSDSERSVVPRSVSLMNNLFWNNQDTALFRAMDDIRGIQFTNNLVGAEFKHDIPDGFSKVPKLFRKSKNASFPLELTKAMTGLSDSLINIANERFAGIMPQRHGIGNDEDYNQIKMNAEKQCGAAWLKQIQFVKPNILVKVDCSNAVEMYQQLEKHNNSMLEISLTGNNYSFTKPILITNNVMLTSKIKSEIHFSTPMAIGNFLIQLEAGKSLLLKNLHLNLLGVQPETFITTDTSGSCNHSNIAITNCSITMFSGTFLNAAKSGICDSIIFERNIFKNNKGIIVGLDKENDKKGYYNTEHLKFLNNKVTDHKGQVISMLRSGTDESTMGPILKIEKNSFLNVNTINTNQPIISLTGIQQTNIRNNSFTNCNEGQKLIEYKDYTKAIHFFSNNLLKTSGIVIKNKYVR